MHLRAAILTTDFARTGEDGTEEWFVRVRCTGFRATVTYPFPQASTEAESHWKCVKRFLEEHRLEWTSCQGGVITLPGNEEGYVWTFGSHVS